MLAACVCFKDTTPPPLAKQLLKCALPVKFILNIIQILLNVHLFYLTCIL